ncbi:MAG: hypothetical protein U0X93_00190 [Anaerolineales bacterium]
MTRDEDLVSKFIKQSKTETKVTPPVTSRKNRILAGVLISIVIAFIYGAIAELINTFSHPELPLYFHPFGSVGNIIYTILIAGISGLISSWSEKALASFTAGGVVLCAGFIISQLLTSSLLFANLVQSPIGLLALPYIGLVAMIFALIMGLVRLAVDLQLEKPQSSWWHWKKTWPILILLTIAITTGYLHKLPIEWIRSLETVDEMLQNGLTAQTAVDLPEPLREEDIGNFLGYADDDYKLEVNNSLKVSFYIRDPNLPTSFRENVVIVYFKNGQDLACLANGAQVLKCFPIIRKIKLPPLIL